MKNIIKTLNNKIEKDRVIEVFAVVLMGLVVVHIVPLIQLQLANLGK